MRNLKSIIIKCVLVLVVAICPIFIVACRKNPEVPSKNENYSKAMSAAIQEIESVGNQQGLSACSLQYDEISEEIDSKKFMMLEYMKKSGETSTFDFPNKIFKANLLTNSTWSIYGLHKYSVNGNNVSAEMAFSYNVGGVDHGFDEVDYEKIEIEYDFDTNTLVSFVWTSYLVQGETLFQLVYEDGVSKILINDATEDYTSLKSQIRDDAEELFTSQDLASKIYDFTLPYRTVFYEYNGYYPDAD